MKKLILTFLLIVIACPSFGHLAFYGPRTIKCLDNACYGMDKAIPKDFNLDPHHITPIPDGLYYFCKADGGMGLSQVWYKQSISRQSPEIRYSSSLQFPYASLPNTKWVQEPEGGYSCITEIPTFCPFYEN